MKLLGWVYRLTICSMPQKTQDLVWEGKLKLRSGTEFPQSSEGQKQKQLYQENKLPIPQSIFGNIWLGEGNSKKVTMQFQFLFLQCWIAEYLEFCWYALIATNTCAMLRLGVWKRGKEEIDVLSNYTKTFTFILSGNIYWISICTTYFWGCLI